MTDYFEHLLDSHSLLNIEIPKIQPTWRNRRIGDDALARRLDRFIIKAQLVDQLDRIRQWVGSAGISDNSPIFFEVMNSNYKPNTPFKFNFAWIEETEFHKIVMEYGSTVAKIPTPH